MQQFCCVLCAGLCSRNWTHMLHPTGVKQRLKGSRSGWSSHSITVRSVMDPTMKLAFGVFLISCSSGESCICTFTRTGHSVLRTNWRASPVWSRDLCSERVVFSVTDLLMPSFHLGLCAHHGVFRTSAGWRNRTMTDNSRHKDCSSERLDFYSLIMVS